MSCYDSCYLGEFVYITEVTGIAGFVKVRLLQKLGNRESQVIT